MKEKKIRFAVLTALFLLGTFTLFPQDELRQRGSIPEELLRPRKSEAPRYPIDTVIGELGQGKAPKEAYEVARRAASALLSGNKSAAVFSPVNKVDLESWMVILNAINPQIFRLGGGREEPDGSVSFLVRFAGRDQGITGELYVRLDERQTPRVAAPPPPINETEIESRTGDDSATQSTDVQAVIPIEENQASATLPDAVPSTDISVVQIWHFEDLILEEARNREEENKEDRHRFDFTPYQRFF